MSRGLIILLFLVNTAAHAQLRFWCGLGYGMYSMTDMKEIQQQIKAGFPIAPQITDNFPPTPFFEIGGLKDGEDGKPFYGLALQFGSTGGRVQYSDYSGSVTSDQLVDYIGITVPFGWAFNRDGTYKFRFDLRPGFAFSSLAITSEFTLGAQTQTDKVKFSSGNLYAQPTFTVERDFGSFGVFAGVGYHITLLAGRVNLQGQDGAYLLSPDGKEAGISWSGVRAIGGIAFKFD